MLESNSERNVGSYIIHYTLYISLKLLLSDEHFDKVGNRNFSAEIYIPDDLRKRGNS